MKRILICLLAALLLTSCGSAPADETTADTSAVSAETTPAETETTVDDFFKVAAEDNGGKTFSLLTTETQQYEYDALELTGDVINDAVYHRNLAVEELLGIDFNFIYKPGDWVNKDSFCQLITNSIMAADGAYDIVSGMISCVQPIVTTQMFMSVYDLPDINMDNPWWVSELQDGLTINGKLIGFIGDMSLSMYKGLSVMFANMGLIENMGLEDPYTMVFEGKWTLDKLVEQTTGIGQDLDGDGTFTVGTDLYGALIAEVPYRSIQASLDIQSISLNEEGIPTVNPLTDKMATAHDKLSAYLKEEGVICQSSGNREETTKITGYFSSDKVVYYMTKLEELDYLRDMENDYAVLPFPKFDENQDKYLTLIATATQMIYIPTTTNDAGLTGKVCESLSFYSYKDVVPAYYDITLKNKYSRDENTQKMMDIIRAGAVMPFEYAYSTMIGGNPWPNKLLSDSTINGQIASMLASAKSSWEAAIEKTMEAYQD